MIQPAQVLLIEDNPGDADLVRLRLVESNTPVNVSCFNRLSDGLASLASHPPTVVLLDLNLPDSHGLETFRKVLEKAPDIPVVILSGQEDEALAMKAIHQGVQDYLEAHGTWKGRHNPQPGDALTFAWNGLTLRTPPSRAGHSPRP